MHRFIASFSLFSSSVGDTDEPLLISTIYSSTVVRHEYFPTHAGLLKVPEDTAGQSYRAWSGFGAEKEWGQLLGLTTDQSDEGRVIKILLQTKDSTPTEICLQLGYHDGRTSTYHLHNAIDTAEPCG